MVRRTWEEKEYGDYVSHNIQYKEWHGNELQYRSEMTNLKWNKVKCLTKNHLVKGACDRTVNRACFEKLEPV